VQALDKLWRKIFVVNGMLTRTVLLRAIDLMQKCIFSDAAYEKLVVEFVTHMFDRNDNF